MIALFGDGERQKVQALEEEVTRGVSLETLPCPDPFLYPFSLLPG
jgi:hypothetical protein